MKRLLLAPLILGLGLPVQAKDSCTFTSQFEPELTIEVSTKTLSYTNGYMKYKGSKIFRFETGLTNGYGGQNFQISTIPNSPTDKKEYLTTGHVVTVVGDQSNRRGTPEDKRKKGQVKIFLPEFASNYYYSLSTFDSKTDGRFGGRTQKMNTILSAAEGFWIPEKGCEKYVYYGWY